MGKGFNNYMTKKFFHPASKDNIKRVWMAKQKTDFEKKKQEDLMAQYQREQEMLSNRALLGDEKAKMGLSFLYDAPPGMKSKEKEDGEPEYKFEWQRKYNAPREAFAKGDDTISDQPFGIEVRNIRCIKCRQWGHVNTDKICPLFGKNLTAEPPQPETSTSSLLEGLKEEGFQLKESMLGKFMASSSGEPILLQGDEDDPEVQFLKSLTAKQKKKLLKKLNGLQKKNGGGKVNKDKKKKTKKAQDLEDSVSSDDDKKKKHKKSKKKHAQSSDESSEDEETYRQGARPKKMKEKISDYSSSRKHHRKDSPQSEDSPKTKQNHRDCVKRIKEERSCSPVLRDRKPNRSRSRESDGGRSPPRHVQRKGKHKKHDSHSRSRSRSPLAKRETRRSRSRSPALMKARGQSPDGMKRERVSPDEGREREREFPDGRREKGRKSLDNRRERDRASLDKRERERKSPDGRRERKRESSTERKRRERSYSGERRRDRSRSSSPAARWDRDRRDRR